MFCASCGAKQDDAARFCMACGAKVKTVTDQKTVDRDLLPQQSVADRPQISRRFVQRPPNKSSNAFNFILGGTLLATLATVVIIFMYERSEAGAQQKIPITQNTAPPANQISLVTAQPATPIEAAWEPYIKYAPCLASNGILMQTFINNGVLPTAQNAASALAACQ